MTKLLLKFKLITMYSIAVHAYLEHGFGGLGVACWPLVPKFAVSNPAEAVRFFKGEKSRRSHVVDLRHVKDP